MKVLLRVWSRCSLVCVFSLELDNSPIVELVKNPPHGSVAIVQVLSTMREKKKFTRLRMNVDFPTQDHSQARKLLPAIGL